MPLLAAMDASARREVRRMAAQNPQAGLLSAVPFSLVHPYQPHERASRRQLRAVDEGPTTICFVVGYFSPFGGGPAFRVLGHRLFARARITRDGGGGQGTTVATHTSGCGVVRDVAPGGKESGGAQR
eukprot:4323956-Pleurochrysis_carterae.AAC.3